MRQVLKAWTRAARSEAPRQRPSSKALVRGAAARQASAWPTATQPFPSLPAVATLSDATWAAPSWAALSRSASVQGKYQVEMRNAVRAWRWLQCNEGGAAAMRYLSRPRRRDGSAGGAAVRRLHLVVFAGAIGVHLPEVRDELQYVLLNRSYGGNAEDPSLPRGGAVRAACPLVLQQLLPMATDVATGGDAMASGALATPLRLADGALTSSAALSPHLLPPPAVGWCEPSDAHELQPCLSQRAAAQGGAPAEARTLSECALACISCALCAALSFSHERATQAAPACMLHRHPCEAPRLLSPNALAGWDVLSSSRLQATALLGGERRAAALRSLPTAEPGHCGPSEQGEEGDCATGDRGSLPFGPNAPSVKVAGATVRRASFPDAIACVRFCADSCPRCNFVSITERGRDCSWYAECKAREFEPRWLEHKTYDARAWGSNLAQRKGT